MSNAYEFALGQRVNLPTNKDVQAVVTLPSSYHEQTSVAVGDGRHWYFLRWLNEDGERDFGWFGSISLVDANTPPEPPAAPVDNDRSVQGTTSRLRSHGHRNRQHKRRK